MNDVTADPRDEKPGSDGVAARRALFGIGAAAGLGALGLAVAPGAEAATAAPALLLGRQNNAGRTSTQIGSTSMSTFEVNNNSNGGRAMLVTGGDGAHGMIARCFSRDRWANQIINFATTSGTGGGLWAQGMQNIAVKAETRASAVPAVVANGAAGDGVAVLATGESYLDGDAMALRSWVGLFTVDDDLGYAPVSSADRATHTTSGQVTLDNAGAATVALPPSYLAGIQRAQVTPHKDDTLMVSLTPFGAAMPNLHVASITADGFTIAGGSNAGTVTWVATGDRLVLEFGPAAAGVAAAQTQRGRTAGVRRRRTLAVD